MSKFLTVILGETKPTLLVSSIELEGFTWEEEEFDDLGIRTIVGFYDWLRTAEQDVIGVRLTIFDQSLDYLVSEFARPSYVKTLPGSVGVEIFFSQATQFEEHLSDDQDFLDNRIYQSKNGIYAISFSAEHSIESLAASDDDIRLINYN